MTRETLATVSAPRETLQRMVAIGSLETEEGGYYDEMLVRVDENRVETPAGKADTAMAAYCTVAPAAFEDVSLHLDRPARAIFDIGAVLGWLDWLEADHVEVALLGDPTEAFAGTIELRTPAETVRVACQHGAEVLAEVTMELPSRFDDDERFRLEDGSFAPTRVETTASELERLVDAVELAETVDGYPFRVADGDLQLEVGSELSMASVEASLEGTAVGPDVQNRYGVELAVVARALRGDLRLQTGPDEPLVVTQVHDLFTLRYVLLPSTW